MILGIVFGLGLSGLIIFTCMDGWSWVSRFLYQMRKKLHPDHMIVNLRISDKLIIDGVPFVIRSWDSNKRHSVIQLEGVSTPKIREKAKKKLSTTQIENDHVTHYEMNAFLLGESIEVNGVLYRIEEYQMSYYGEQKPQITLRQWGSKAPTYYSYI